MTASPKSPGGEAEAGAPGRKRLHYGWVVVGASVVLLAGLLGTQLCFGLFIIPLGDQFGWTRAATSGAMSLCMGVSGLVGILMGRFSDKYNMGIVVALGTLAGTASYLLLSIMDSLWEFYLFFGLGVGICAGCAYTPVAATVSKWFGEKRALALGVALSGLVVGQMVLSPVLNRLIGDAGWRTGFFAMAVIVFACGLPGMVLLARRPDDSDRHATAAERARGHESGHLAQGYSAKQATKTAPFWMLMITGFTIAFGFYVMISQIKACAQDLGVPSESASLILTVSGVGSLAGSFLAWWLAKRLGGRWSLLMLVLGQGAAMFLFMLTHSVWSFFAAAVLFGFSFGAASPTRMSLVPPLFGLKAVGAILGWSSFAWSIGGIAGPYLAGYIHDTTGSYDLAFLTGGLLLIVGALSLYFWGSHSQVTDPGQ
jgi:OFA family oxalate/formate antiporter-like MFS transporter